MDLEIFKDMYIPIVTAACLIVGFILKKWIKDLDNKWIPTILAVLGVVLGCLANQGITLGKRSTRRVFRSCQYGDASSV